MKTHYRTHTGEKPFRCTEIINRIDSDTKQTNTCSKAFSTSHSLKSHARTHTKKSSSLQDKGTNQTNSVTTSNTTPVKRRRKIKTDTLQLQNLQNLSNSIDINYSFESVFVTEQQVPQLSFTAQTSDTTISDLSSCITTETNHDYIDYSELLSTSKETDETDMDFSTFEDYSSQLQDINTPQIKENNPFNSERQPQTSQAVQMALASEIEIPSPWIDVAVLASKPVIPTDPVTSACLALPTAIPSYVDLPFNVNTAATNYYQQNDNLINQPSDLDVGNNFENLNLDDFSLTTVNPVQNTKENEINESESLVDRLLEDANQMDISNENQTVAQQLEADSILNDILMSIDSLQNAIQAPRTSAVANGDEPLGGNEKTSNKMKGATLQEITADADICSCVKCECDQKAGCSGGCGPHNPCKSDNPIAISTNKIEKKSECCSSKKSNTKKAQNLNVKEATNLITSLATSPCCSTNVQGGSACSCKSPLEGIKNGCCVVICLKTLEHLRSVLNSSTVNLIKCSGAGGVL